jgi:Fe-Mn family superoxide dismutase
MATYELPPLPYDYDALEPHIDSRIMELHHDAHHQGYVDGANAALDSLEEMRESGDFSDAKPVERSLSFNLSGHVNHSVFWGNMSPDGGGEPGGELADKIEEDFYLQYENNKGEYIDNWWEVVDWDNVAEQYDRAQQGHGV